VVCRRRRRGKVEYGIRGSEQCGSIIAHTHARGNEPHQSAYIGAESLMIRHFARRGDAAAIGFIHGTGQRQAHAAGSTNDSYSQFSHVFPRGFAQ
jgi:hypothetical protein